MGERRVFTKEFKDWAIELAEKSGRKQSEIAADLGIGGSMLARWKREARRAKAGPLKGFSSESRNKELVRLRKEIADLQKANDILKKQCFPNR